MHPPYLSTLPSPRSGLHTSPSLKSLSSRISRAIFSSILAIQYPGYVSASTCVLPSSARAKTHHPRRWRYYILGWQYRENRGAAYRSAYIENPRCHRCFAKRTSALPCFRWTRDIRLMFPGSYHMILDVSFGFITVSEVSHPHKRFYYQRRCTAKASADSIVYCGPGDFKRIVMSSNFR